MKAREYAGPLGILAAGAIGLSLLCSVSTMAMSDLNHRIAATVQPINILDLAFSNIETVAALTEQAVTAFVPSPTLVPTNTLSPTPVPSDTATPRRFLSPTPTSTRRTRDVSPTPIPPPTQTRTRIPPSPTKTNPPPPTKTYTPVPPSTLTYTVPPPITVTSYP